MSDIIEAAREAVNHVRAIHDPPRRSEETSQKESYAHHPRSATAAAGLGKCQAVKRMAAICHPNQLLALRPLRLFAAQGENDSLIPLSFRLQNKIALS